MRLADLLAGRMFFIESPWPHFLNINRFHNLRYSEAYTNAQKTDFSGDYTMLCMAAGLLWPAESVSVFTN